MTIGILGGGLSGLTTASLLKRPCEVLEKEDRPGGLCRSFFVDGYGFDIGGHILFSRDPELLGFACGLLGDNVEQRRRNNKILYKNRFVKYPFENGLGELDKQDIFECLQGYLENPHAPPTNFREWLLATFGNGIAGKYLIPYNEKIWKYPLEKMDLAWVERVPKPPLVDILKSALGIETEGYTHQLYFSYPRTGGIESLIASLHARVPQVTTGFTVRSIERTRDGWDVCDGSRRKRFERLIITCPVTEVVHAMKDVPEEVRLAADGLLYNSVVVVLVGINSTRLMDKSGIYIPDPGVLPHRVCYPGFFSPSMVPEGCSSLIAEMTFPPGNALLRCSDEELTERVIADLTRLGFFTRDEITVTAIRRLERGYVLYDQHRQRHMQTIRSYFTSAGIALCGRFAEFEYLNMDECLNRARRLATEWNAP